MRYNENMNENKFTVEFFEHNNKIPVQEFILKQNEKVQAKILQKINLLEEYGNFLKEPNSKYLQSGIFELRIKERGNNYRVLYFFFIGNKIVLTNGFFKKTQKTPRREIEKALAYKREYESRYKNEN